MTAAFPPLAADEPSLLWFLKGAARVASLPTLVLVFQFIGFAALARDVGVGLGEALAMTFFVWALPSILVLTGAAQSGIGLVVAAIAVALSAIRLMPMTLALMPIIRTPRTRKLTLFVAAHYVALTAWVFGMTALDDIPRPARAIYFIGYAGTLTTLITLVTGIGYGLAAALPPLLAMALTLLTPINFALLLWRGAKLVSDKLALILGVAVTPLAHALTPQWSVVVTGLTAGLAAYGIGRLVNERRAAAAGEGP
jgi:predicted branched-subunit amino acid permease